VQTYELEASFRAMKKQLVYDSLTQDLDNIECYANNKERGRMYATKQKTPSAIFKQGNDKRQERLTTNPDLAGWSNKKLLVHVHQRSMFARVKMSACRSLLLKTTRLAILANIA